MMKYILLYVYVISLFVNAIGLQAGKHYAQVVQQHSTVWNKPAPLSQVVIEQDVIIGNTLPRYGLVCIQTISYGDPHMITELQPIAAGTHVNLREMVLGDNGTWFIMIKAAVYIRMDSLCGFGE
jgi:hypothetical protein